MFLFREVIGRIFVSLALGLFVSLKCHLSDENFIASASLLIFVKLRLAELRAIVKSIVLLDILWQAVLSDSIENPLHRLFFTLALLRCCNLPLRVFL